MAFDTSVSGILAATADLGIIGNNIANASTTGFKSARGEFSDVYAASLLGAGASIGQGVQLSTVSTDFSQGNVSFTTNSLDLAINGPGFFRLSDGGVSTYTRAGAFQLDKEGNITTAGGLKLQGYPLDDTGNITGELGDVRLSTALIDPRATSSAELTANLDSRGVKPLAIWGNFDADGARIPFDAFAQPPTAPDADMFNSSTSLTVYDGLGNPHVASIYFVKTDGLNTWNVHTLIDGVEIGDPKVLSFGNDGLLPTDPEQPLLNTVEIAGWEPQDSDGALLGVDAQSFAVDLASFTQFGKDFAVSYVNQDGYTSGQLRGIEIDQSGILFSRYTNGQSRQVGQIALASFTNEQGLKPSGDTTFVESFASGQPSISTPGTGGTGLLSSGALEGSNVELTSQLVRMIIAQRNFQASAQMIQTEDAVTQAVINLR
jgi:flagellar hook protein FlgE